ASLFCRIPRNQALRLSNPKRFSAILDLDPDVHNGGCASLASWFKAGAVCKDLAEVHLSFNIHRNWSALVKETIVPSLLDLEAHLASTIHFKRPPRVKVSIQGAIKAHLEYVQSCLARLKKSGLVVVQIRRYSNLGASGILDGVTMSRDSEDMLEGDDLVPRSSEEVSDSESDVFISRDSEDASDSIALL
ncbi:hypothetical protein BKA70DRAFT_1294788, partial [Coprinopsis sp. MPI-PUGE-AT-0042]